MSLTIIETDNQPALAWKNEPGIHREGGHIFFPYFLPLDGHVLFSIRKRVGRQNEWPQQDSNNKRKDIQLKLAATSRRKCLVSIRFLMTKVERLSCLRPSTECLFCLSHALLTKPEKSLWRTVITRSGWCGQRLSPKINSSQMPICARTHMRILYKEWVGAVFLPERT